MIELKKKGGKGGVQNNAQSSKRKEKNLAVVKYEETHRGGSPPDPRLLLMFVASFVKEVTVKACEISLYLNIMEMTLAELVWCSVAVICLSRVA